jgi:hypothetical protein
LDDTHLRPGDRLAERLGDLPRGPDRDGLLGGHRGDLHLQAVWLLRTRRIQSGHHHRRRRVDRDHDLDLLPRHRALGAHPAGAARRRGVHPRAVQRGRIRQGLRQPSSERLDQAVAVLDQSLRDELLRPRRRAAARRVHLLGLGFRGGCQRGVRGSGRGSGQGRGHLDDHARADLRRRDGGRPVLPRPSAS